jgi:hypothetical protein
MISKNTWTAFCSVITSSSSDLDCFTLIHKSHQCTCGRIKPLLSFNVLSSALMRSWAAGCSCRQMPPLLVPRWGLYWIGLVWWLNLAEFVTEEVLSLGHLMVSPGMIIEIGELGLDIELANIGVCLFVACVGVDTICKLVEAVPAGTLESGLLSCLAFLCLGPSTPTQ